MKVAWTVIAALCLVAAAVALWELNLNAAFVIAAVGLLAWFLRYRSDLKESLSQDERTFADDQEEDTEDET